MVSEIYSPARVAKELRRLGLPAGSAYDVTTGCVFTSAENRRRARQQIDEESPWLIAVSPMCKAFSQLMNLGRKKMGEERFQRLQAKWYWKLT